MRRPRAANGFSLLELVIALFVASVITAAALPQVKRGVYGYRLSAEVDMVTWAIQSTRFQALKDGYPYQVVFNHTTNAYQIQSEVPPATTFSNVGSSVPLSGSAVTLNQDMTIQMKPNGSLSTTVGTQPLNVVYQGSTKQITVTNYGNVLVQ